MPNPPTYTGPERRATPRRGTFRPLADALYGTIRWIGRHVRGFYAAVGLFLAVGLGVALLALGLLALLAEWMAAGAVDRWDVAALLWVRQHEHPLLDALAIVGAGLGSSAAAWIVIFAGTFLLWRTRHRYSAYLLWVSLAGGVVLNRLLKALFDRPRPDLFDGDLELLRWTFSFPRSPSFPSGHALMAMVIFGTLAYLVARLEPTPRLRRLTFAAAALVILLVGLSRIYLGVHYPSDVLAGYLAGFVWATFAALGIEAVRYFRNRKPEVIREERDLEQGIRPL